MKLIHQLCWLSLSLGLIVTACSPVRVTTNRLENEVGNYRTFNFYDVNVQNPDSIPSQPARIEMLKDAVARELTNLGLEQAANPDLWVNIGVVVEDKVQTRQTDIREAPVYIGQRNYHWESEEVVVNEYRQGTVTIDLISAATNQMVGQSVASSVLVADDEKLQKRINEGVAQVFDELWVSSQ